MMKQTKMNFDAFCQYVEDRILGNLPAAFQAGTIRIDTVSKLGRTYRGMTVFRNEETAAPTVDLDRFYHLYEEGASEEEILLDIAKVVQLSALSSPDDLEWAMHYQTARKHLCIRLSPIETNRDLLRNVPYTQVEDLAVTYHVVKKTEKGHLYGMMITNDMQKKYGVSLAELHADALESSPLIAPPKMIWIQDRQLLAITNRIGQNGAAALLYPGVLTNVTEKMGSWFYLLPSSIHEWIAVHPAQAPEPEQLRLIVREVNRKEVEDGDWLSDEIYMYDPAEDRLKMA